MSKPDLAIFDLDNTILNGDSDYSMINYLIDINLLNKNAKLKNDEFILDYQQGQLDFNQYTNFALNWSGSGTFPPNDKPKKKVHLFRPYFL